MANTFRFFNLSQMSLGAYNGLTYSWDVKKVVDLTELTGTLASNWGVITSGGNNFPNYGAGLERGTFLADSFTMGDITTASVTSYDFGAIA
jgi:hypothetical protein